MFCSLKQAFTKLAITLFILALQFLDFLLGLNAFTMKIEKITTANDKATCVAKIRNIEDNIYSWEEGFLNAKDL